MREESILRSLSVSLSLSLSLSLSVCVCVCVCVAFGCLQATRKATASAEALYETVKQTEEELHH